LLYFCLYRYGPLPAGCRLTLRLLGMKRILLITVAVLTGMVAINAALDHANNCDCLDDCWCKTSLGRHARWWVPARYQSLRSSSG
jgi:hypothetical protein